MPEIFRMFFCFAIGISQAIGLNKSVIGKAIDAKTDTGTVKRPMGPFVYSTSWQLRRFKFHGLRRATVAIPAYGTIKKEIFSTSVSQIKIEDYAKAFI